MKFLVILALNFFTKFLLSAQPTITSFSPSCGSIGTLVTITGNNLNSPTNLIIGGVSAIAISNTGTSLVAMVMPGAVSGTISITTTSGSTSSNTNFIVSSSIAPNSPQGGKIIGMANSVSISADGNTAVLGGIGDNIGQGAAWIYTRIGGVWTQQGNKLVGSGSAINSQQGTSVSISADGNNVIVGGQFDNNGQGAAWIYTRSGGIWTQQGSKLVGTGGTTNARQGKSVSISADGNTAIIGGPDDNSGHGAVWIFTRSNGVWTQQGSKIVGSGNSGIAQQGYSVSISADGNTTLIGGYFDNFGKGAAWIFTRSGGVWTQQGSKLVGTGGFESIPNQGISVCISADGNTAIVGGNAGVGGAWIYTRNGGVWTQQGSKLVGSGASGFAYQGESLSISADGNTAVIGGYGDNNNQGAIWIFTRNNGIWSQYGTKIVGTNSIGNSQQGRSVCISSDGNTGIVGGIADNNYVGAWWVFNNMSDLNNLTISSGTLTPTFTATNTSYNTNVSNNISSISVTPTSTESNAIIRVQINNGGFSNVNSGSPSIFLPLNVGSNSIEISVTAKDGITIKTYYIIVNKESCQSQLTLVSTIDDYSSGTILKTASNIDGKIMATNKITNNAKVTYNAKVLELNVGFKADVGTVFLGEIGGCN